mgnify:CR=1 FL=1
MSRKTENKMETLIKDFYCKLCSLQFDKGIVFDMHQSIVHGIAIKIKEEPVNSENKSRTDNKSIQCHICEGTFPTRKTLFQNMKERAHSSVNCVIQTLLKRVL